MQPEALREAADWLTRAGRDLSAARRCLTEPEPLPDVAVFHSQQAAEKALKAFLAAHNHPFPRIHDLERLAEWREQIDSDFVRFLGAAEALNPYVIAFRYPGGPLAPDLDEAHDALELASEIVDFVRRQVFPEGQT